MQERVMNRGTRRIFSTSQKIRGALLSVITGSLWMAAAADAGVYDTRRLEVSDTCRDIASVRVRSGWWIDAVQLVCRDKAQPRRGGTGGGMSVFQLKPGERITGISGRRNGPAGNYVYALQIHTNLRSSRMFGEGGPQRGASPFRFNVPAGHIATGFGTKSGRYLESISLATERMPYYSSNRGYFHDNCRDVAEVRVRSGWWVDAVQVVCRDQYSPQRGGSGGGLQVFNLQRGEYITGISGMKGGPAGDYVYALQFHTNFRSSPVYGQGGPQRGWQPFRVFARPGEKVSGLSGNSDRYLNFITPITTPQFTSRPTYHRYYDGRQVNRNRSTRSGYTSYRKVYR